MSTVVITGGASGIGKACAEVLCAAGRDIALWDIDDAKTRDAAQALAASSGCVVTAQQVDVARLDALAEAAAEARQQHPEIGALVHAAGVDGAVPLAQLDPGQWQRIMDINLGALPFIIKALRDSLAAAADAAIVGIASINATLGNGANPAYSASKAGMLGLVRALADDLAHDGIRINAVSPGQIDTPMLQASMDVVDGLRAAFEKRILLGRLGTPHEVAQAVSFLLSAQASYITATELVVDGGNLSSQR